MAEVSNLVFISMALLVFASTLTAEPHKRSMFVRGNQTVVVYHDVHSKQDAHKRAFLTCYDALCDKVPHTNVDVCVEALLHYGEPFHSDRLTPPSVLKKQMRQQRLCEKFLDNFHLFKSKPSLLPAGVNIVDVHSRAYEHEARLYNAFLTIKDMYVRNISLSFTHERSEVQAARTVTPSILCNEIQNNVTMLHDCGRMPAMASLKQDLQLVGQNAQRRITQIKKGLCNAGLGAPKDHHRPFVDLYIDCLQSGKIEQADKLFELFAHPTDALGKVIDLNTVKHILTNQQVPMVLVFVGFYHAEWIERCLKTLGYEQTDELALSKKACLPTSAYMLFDDSSPA